MLYYRDFTTRKLRRTFGKPVGIRRDGPMNAEGLIIRNRSSELFIPEYLLEGASRAWFNDFKAKQHKDWQKIATQPREAGGTP